MDKTADTRGFRLVPSPGTWLPLLGLSPLYLISQTWPGLGRAKPNSARAPGKVGVEGAQRVKSTGAATSPIYLR